MPKSAVESLGENFNVAPTNDIYGVVVEDDGRPKVQAFLWGLIPVWAKERKIGQRMINARAETIAEKTAFKGVFKKHRCIIPMDGFYEWAAGVEGGPVTKAGKLAKRPHFIHRVDGEPLAVAGLWSAWRDKTEGPDAPVAAQRHRHHHRRERDDDPVHDRMPVILPKAMWDDLARPVEPEHRHAVQPCWCRRPSNLLTMHEVSTDVNNVRNKGEDLIDPTREPVTPHVPLSRRVPGRRAASAADGSGVCSTAAAG